jgi:metallo-beta-lactamase family protein
MRKMPAISALTPAVSILLLTHAHPDHCGRIPLLSKCGFRGEIITTAASRELSRLVMLDSARPLPVAADGSIYK